MLASAPMRDEVLASEFQACLVRRAREEGLTQQTLAVRLDVSLYPSLDPRPVRFIRFG